MKRVRNILIILVAVLGMSIPLTTGSVRAFAEEVTDIYVDGAKGDDTRTGLDAGSAVQTLEKAKELALAHNAERLRVTGTLNVSGDVTLKGTRAVLMRDPAFDGYLLNITGPTTLSDITVDGNAAEAKATKSLIQLKNTSLEIRDGAVLTNNILTDLQAYHAEGGAVYAENATITMMGGVISRNTANRGGGIYALGSIITMSGGIIEENHAVVDYTLLRSSRDPAELYSAGGGIVIFDGGTLNLSARAVIRNNSSSDIGGGISLGTTQASIGSLYLNMTGGTVSGNTAGASGGGIFVQVGISLAGYPEYETVARITGGDITGNVMSDRGDGNTAFGGGGVYVNGNLSSGDGYTFHNGILYLSNALITDNYAWMEGGGYASCPISTTRIDDGAAAIYGNRSEMAAKDVYVLGSHDEEWEVHAGNPTYSVSPLMLGNQPAHWKDNAGTEVPLDKLSGVLNGAQNESLDLHTDETPSEAALSHARVRITGNESRTRGAGIGSNGTVIMTALADSTPPDPPAPEVTSVHVTKRWDGLSGEGSEGNRPVLPESIQVELYRATGADGTEPEYIGYQSITPDADGKWETTFTNLPSRSPDGTAYAYSVRERALSGYSSEVTGSAADGFVITNKPAVSVSVRKVWEGTPADRVTVELLADGEVIQTREVTAADGWATTFTDLPVRSADTGARIAYTVRERALDGYATTVTGSVSDGFVITNAQRTSVSVEKRWLGKPADRVTVELLADGEVVQTRDLTATDGWTTRFTDLPVVSNGQTITYTVRERALDGYATTVTGSAADSFVITNTELTSVHVTKRWLGAPAERVTVELLANGAVTQKRDITSAENWTTTFENLPTTDAEGKAVAYSVRETLLDGYASTVSGSAAEGFVLTNTELTSVRVTKRWIGQPATSVTVELLAGQRVVESTTLTAETGWETTFENLPTTDTDGTAIAYTVRETPIPGYASVTSGSAAEGFVLTNTALRDITVTKRWVGVPAEGVMVDLLADGVVVQSRELTAAGGWMAIFSNLPVSTGDHDILYTVRERPVEGYSTVVDGFLITNTELMSVKVTKRWIGEPADAVTVELLAGDRVVQSRTLTAETGWETVFENLPVGEYTVREVPLDGYSSSVAGNATDGFVLTNTQLRSIEVTKRWVGVPAARASVDLLADGVVIESRNITAEDGWRTVFADLPVSTGDHDILYTVRERPLEGYSTVVDGFLITNTQLTSVKVTKRWVGTPADSVTVELLAGDRVVESRKLTVDTGWETVFENLPVGEYTVREIPLDGYTSTLTGNATDGFVFTNTQNPTVPICPDCVVKPQPKARKPLLARTGTSVSTLVFALVLAAMMSATVLLIRRK
ncbi:Cna B-type domain-containing protein [Alloscardovia macacae]|uniref:Cna protein B-type domain-containing protein n=1 Tax=Alloscardovia macacae TaxID=1160091 RepID=A0A261F400_9BIFI|nr:Cna B-type domain-containing protein [Alloscardovia macacae]OZG53646.1 Cna protein B-type domain-containing protein [Alloscardovia macacae]